MSLLIYLNDFYWYKTVDAWIRHIKNSSEFIATIYVDHKVSKAKLPNFDILLKHKNLIDFDEDQVRRFANFRSNITHFKIEVLNDKISIISNSHTLILRKFRWSNPNNDIALSSFVQNHELLYDNRRLTDISYDILIKHGVMDEAFYPPENSYMVNKGYISHTFDTTYHKDGVVKKGFFDMDFGKCFISPFHNIYLDTLISQKIKNSKGKFLYILLREKKKGSPLFKQATYTKEFEAGTCLLSKQDHEGYITTSDITLIVIANVDFGWISELEDSMKAVSQKVDGSITHDCLSYNKYKEYNNRINSITGYHLFDAQTYADKIRLDFFLDTKDYGCQKGLYLSYLGNHITIGKYDREYLYLPSSRKTLIDKKLGENYYVEAFFQNFLFNLNVPEVVFLHFLRYVEAEGLANPITSHGLKYDIPYYSYLEDKGSIGTFMNSVIKERIFMYVPLFIFDLLYPKIKTLRNFILITTYQKDHPILKHKHRIIYNAPMEKFGVMMSMEDVAIVTNLDINLEACNWPHSNI